MFLLSELKNVPRTSTSVVVFPPIFFPPPFFLVSSFFHRPLYPIFTPVVLPSPYSFSTSNPNLSGRWSNRDYGDYCPPLALPSLHMYFPLHAPPQAPFIGIFWSSPLFPLFPFPHSYLLYDVGLTVPWQLLTFVLLPFLCPLPCFPSNRLHSPLRL